MTAKEYLSQAHHIDQRIRSKQEQIVSLNNLATSCSAIITDTPRNPNCSGSRMENVVCKIVDLENDISADMEALIQLKAEIIATIKAVECIEYQLILEKRYIDDKSWPDIAVDLGFKMRHLYKLHDKALKAIKIPEKYFAVQ